MTSCNSAYNLPSLISCSESRWISLRTLERLRAQFTELDSTETGKIIRPSVRRFLVRAGRMNIPYTIQEAIFEKKYTWKFDQIISDIILNPKYYFDVLDNDHHFERFCLAIEAGKIKEAENIMKEDFFDITYHNSYSVFLASEHGHLGLIQTLLKIKGINPSSNNALVAAAENGHTEIVKYLLKDPRVDPTIDENFALRLASQSGHLEVVRLLLADPRVDPSARENFSIRLSAENNHIEVVKLLLKDRRVDPSAKGNVIIQITAENGNDELVSVLLADPRVDPSADDSLAIKVASESGKTEVVRQLLHDGRANPAAKNDHPLRLACQGGHFDVASLLLEDPRVHPNADNDFPLCVAAQSGYTDLVKMLMKYPSVNVGADDNYAIQIAAQRGFTGTVREILKSPQCNPDSERGYALKAASSNGHLEIVSLLLADPRVHPDQTGCEAMPSACKSGHTEIVKVLLADPRVPIGASLDIACSSGRTEIASLLLEDPRTNITLKSLIKSCQGGYENLVRLLIQKGVDPSQRENVAIRKAAQKGHVGVIKILLEHSQVTTKAIRQSDLFHAVTLGFINVLQLLLDDPHFDTTQLGVDCFFAACEFGHQPIVQLFLSHEGLKSTCLKEVQASTALRLAVEKGHTDTARTLLNNEQIQPVVDLNEILGIACDSGCEDLIEFIHVQHSVPLHFPLLNRAKQNSHFSTLHLLARKMSWSRLAEFHLFLEQMEDAIFLPYDIRKLFDILVYQLMIFHSSSEGTISINDKSNPPKK